jgi:hypothetical protein
MAKSCPSAGGHRIPMRWAISISFAAAAWSAAFSSDAVETTSPTTIQLDPFAQATRGFDGCPMSSPPLVTPEEMRIIAHERAERGTYCALEGRCEPGGAYRRDPEVNERVRAAVAQDQRFTGTSVAVATTRRFVTLTGCVRSRAQRRALVAFVASLPGVDRVFDETRVGLPAARSHDVPAH